VLEIVEFVETPIHSPPLGDIRGPFSIIGRSLGADNIPNNILQFKSWVKIWLPGGEQVHTFGLAAICWAIWKCRNKACFDKKPPRSPIDIIMYACSFMSFWAGLYNQEFQSKILEGFRVVMEVACSLPIKPPPPPRVLALLPPKGVTNSEGDAKHEANNLDTLRVRWRSERCFPYARLVAVFVSFVGCSAFAELLNLYLGILGPSLVGAGLNHSSLPTRPLFLLGLSES